MPLSHTQQPINFDFAYKMTNGSNEIPCRSDPHTHGPPAALECFIVLELHCRGKVIRLTAEIPLSSSVNRNIAIRERERVYYR